MNPTRRGFSDRKRILEGGYAEMQGPTKRKMPYCAAGGHLAPFYATVTECRKSHRGRYTDYLAPPISRRDEEGFSSCSPCPSSRAAAITPSECPLASARFREGHAAFALTVWARLPRPVFSRPLVRSLALRPGDSLTAPRAASSMGFRSLLSLLPAIRATELLAVAAAGLTPAEHSSLRLDEHRNKRPKNPQGPEKQPALSARRSG